MTNVTLKGLPPGNATLHYAAKVEPARNRTDEPKGTPLVTTAVTAGEVTFDLTPEIEYVIFGSDGRGRNAILSTTKVSTL